METALSISTFFKHMILGIRSRSDVAVTANGENICINAHNNVVKKRNHKISLVMLKGGGSL